MFRKYHYLSHVYVRGDDYVVTLNSQPIAFCNVGVFPHPRAKNIMRIQRLVVLPDYQGIGIGKILLDWVSDRYAALSKRVRIVTSNKALVMALSRDDRWKLKHQGRLKPARNRSSLVMSRRFGKKLTTTWEYSKIVS